MQEAVRGVIEPFKQLTIEQELQTQYAKTYSRLLTEGMLPAEAERIANFEKMVSERSKALDIEMDILRAQLAQAEVENLPDQIVRLEKEVALLEKKREAVAGAAAAGPGEGLSDADRIQSAVDASREALNELVDPVNQIVGAATAIGDAFANSFKGLVTGATTAREAMRNFFSSLADYFADMAAKMIAEALKMQAIKLLSSLLSSLAGAAGPAGAGAASAVGKGKLAIAGFANGGRPPVGRPSLVGERGPELFVPFQAGQIVPTEVIAAAAATRDALRMPAAQVPFQGSTTQAAAAQVPFQGSTTQAAAAQVPFQGSTTQAAAAQVPFQGMGSGLVIPFQAAAAADRNPASVATNELIRFESTVINGMEFVTRQEAEKIGQTAASRGAELAQKRLKNNPTARRAAGIS
jgi:hypothetical protein